MRDHIRILGWCFIVYSANIVLVGLGIGSIVMFGGAISGDHEAFFITSAVGAAIACFLIVISGWHRPAEAAAMGAHRRYHRRRASHPQLPARHGTRRLHALGPAQ